MFLDWNQRIWPDRSACPSCSCCKGCSGKLNSRPILRFLQWKCWKSHRLAHIHFLIVFFCVLFAESWSNGQRILLFLEKLKINKVFAAIIFYNFNFLSFLREFAIFKLLDKTYQIYLLEWRSFKYIMSNSLNMANPPKSFEH